MKPSPSENQAKAPKCAEFVAQMREVFGADQIKVLYVKEGKVELGEFVRVPE
jgi:hypothetical protein